MFDSVRGGQLGNNAMAAELQNEVIVNLKVCARGKQKTVTWVLTLPKAT